MNLPPLLTCEKNSPPPYDLSFSKLKSPPSLTEGQRQTKCPSYYFEPMQNHYMNTLKIQCKNARISEKDLLQLSMDGPNVNFEVLRLLDELRE